MTTLRIVVDLRQQTLTLLDDEAPRRVFPISTAKNGAGETMGSGCTPRGRHIVRAMIGRSLPPGSVFVGRRPTGEVYSPSLGQQQPGRDWILSRILWLRGCEPGRNRFGPVDTMRRYIYIHGCPESEPMGTAASHGCIRMRNADVIELFDMVEPGVPVTIHE